MEDFYPTAENGRENTVLVQEPKPGDASVVKKQRNCLHTSTEKINQEEEDSSLSDVNSIIKGFWSELHADLLEPIACRLGRVDLLAFCGTCKAWRSASFNASAEIESKVYHTTWFLQYDNPDCLLYDPSQDRH
ncbi:uncharacterized protein LOC122091166 isoform X2 [Macadamia integrifolia]|uniref:uncharacterized protein LOC122091166 isoform X2 n=1 Tax=Macadamia integrifolia TaxID=60698 RepID=UPI001C4E5B8F|nr:uncharacterized protein LOC122091166 isoform X2 [Macadamia integrifolia]